MYCYKEYNHGGGLPVDLNGEVNFSNYVHMGDDFIPWDFKLSDEAIANAKINPKKQRKIDIAEAWKRYESQIPDYVDKETFMNQHTWHHTNGRLQLVPTDLHNAITHHGGIAGQVKIQLMRTLNIVFGEEVVRNTLEGNVEEAVEEAVKDNYYINDIDEYVAAPIKEKGNEMLEQAQREYRERMQRKMNGLD